MSERARLNLWLGTAGEPGSRAEGLAHAGDLSGALAAVEAELRASPPDAWAYLTRAGLRYKRGDADGAAADAAEFRRLMPESAAGRAVEALLAAGRGDQPASSAAADEAVERSGGASWARALRGTLRGRFGLLHEAKLELEAADSPEAWALAARADVQNRLGYFWLSLEDLERLRLATPGDPEADVLAAAIHRDQAQYKPAMAKLSRAEALFPRDPRFARLKAEIRFLEGKMALAAGEIARALALTPHDDGLRFEHARLLLLAGREKEAEAELAAMGPSAMRSFLLGYARARRKRWKEAERLFGEAREWPGREADHLREKAALYRWVAREMPLVKPRRREGPREFRMAGLGYRQPFQTTVETLAWISSCDVLFSNLSDPAVVDFVGLFAVPFRAIVFRRDDKQAVRCAKDVMPAFRTHKVVGIVTRGHPLFYGRLAWRVATLSKRRGYSVRVPGSVSIADTISALAPSGGGTGVEIRDAQTLGSLDPRLPLMIYNLATDETGRESLAAKLREVYPPTHACALLAGMGEREFLPDTSTLENLSAALARVDEATTLFLPALK